MIKKIIPVIMMIGAVIGGAVAADFIKNQDSSGAKDAAHDGHKTSHDKDKKDSHGKAKDDGHGGKKDDHKTDKKKDKKSKGGHGKKNYTDGSDGKEYMKFDRQFVVPVMKGDNIDALVIMNLTVELTDDASGDDDVYRYLPRMRDAMVRELLSLSNRDVFGANLTSVENYQEIRDALLKAAKSVMPDGVEDILILDLARQEQ